MANPRSASSFFLFAVILALTANAQCRGQTFAMKEKVTNLHFFFHDSVSGTNPTAIVVARGPSNYTSGFGTVVVIDDPLTVGPDPTSPLLGRAQGTYTFAAQQTTSLVMGVDYIMTAGPYTGSSFVVLSSNPVTETQREVAVVGGRGAFRMARGFALLNTISLSSAGDAVVEYNVTLLH